MSWFIQREPVRIKGEAITTLEGLLRHLNAGGYVIFNHKAYHPSVISNWSLARLTYLCRCGGLYQAIPNPKRTHTPERQLELRRIELSAHFAALRRFRQALGERTGP